MNLEGEIVTALKFSISLNYEHRQQTPIIVTISQIFLYHIAILFRCLKILFTHAPLWILVVLDLLLDHLFNVLIKAAALPYKICAKNSLITISMQLVFFVIWCILFDTFKNLILRKGSWRSTDRQRCAWHTECLGTPVQGKKNHSNLCPCPFTCEIE